MQAVQLNVVVANRPSSREILENKARVYSKTSAKYQPRTNKVLDVVESLRKYTESRGLSFYATDLMPVSRRATKSTKYRIECRIGTGDLVPTVVFRDSMNGESCTFIDFGIFRKVCSNGLHIATSQELVFKQNHLKVWALDDYQIASIFEQACNALDTLSYKYFNAAIPAGNTARIARNMILERLATNGVVTHGQAELAGRYSIKYYDTNVGLFGVLNAVQESLTTNRNGEKKVTDANASLNRKLLPAIESAIMDLWPNAA